MSKYSPEIPFYCDIPIYGEIVFNCDRRIWQTTLFNKFIYNRKPSEIGRLYISYNKMPKINVNTKRLKKCLLSNVCIINMIKKR